MFNDVSYVIQHRDHSKTKDRTRNLLIVLDYIRKFSKIIEIVIIEQDSEETNIKELVSNFNVRYEFLYNPGLFNRSWGFNFASTITEKPKLIFADNDMLIDKECLSTGIKLLDGFSVVRPYNGYSNDLSEEQTNQYIATKIIPNGYSRNIHNISGGVVMFDKKSFENIGMFDERFEGWGGEDDEMMLNIKNNVRNERITVATLNKPVVHLYHSRANLNDGVTQPNYLKNVSYITDGNRNSGIVRLGDRNKYVKN